MSTTGTDFLGALVGYVTSAARASKIRLLVYLSYNRLTKALGLINNCWPTLLSVWTVLWVSVEASKNDFNFYATLECRELDIVIYKRG